MATNTQNEKNNVANAFYDICELLSEEAWKMNEQSDFNQIVAVAKTELQKFSKSHSETATQTLAEKICEYAVFDVRGDSAWQIDAYEYEFEMSSWTYGLSDNEYSEATEWTHHSFQFEPTSSRSKTTLHLIATISSKSTIIREAVIW